MKKTGVGSETIEPIPQVARASGSRNFDLPRIAQIGAGICATAALLAGCGCMGSW